MEIKDINKYFSNKILRRGYDYYKNKRVKVIYKNNNKYEAIVIGSREYKVIIDLSNNNYQMTCTCPYEDKCKHEAALLYCLKNNSLEIKDGSIKDLTKELPPLERFKKDLHQEISDLDYKYGDNDYDYYDYYEEDEEIESEKFNEYANILKKYTKMSVKNSSDNDYLIDTFKILLDTIDNCYMNSTTYSRYDLLDVMVAGYSEILKNKEIFARILSTLVDLITKDYNYFYECIGNSLSKNIKTKWQASYLVNYYSDIEQILKENIFEKIEIMYNYLDKERALREAENPNYLGDRKTIDWLLNIYQNDKLKQAKLLEKYCKINHAWLNNNYWQKLLDIYKKIDLNKYKKYLLEYYKENPNYHDYLELKSTFNNKEFQNIKETILEISKDNKNLYCDICLNEKKYSEILSVLKDSSIDLVIEYIPNLSKIYPKELFDIYKNKLILYINNAKGKSSYERIGDYFSYLMKFPNGKDEVLKIIEYINITFPTRKVLNEEMNFYKDTYL